MRKNNSLFNNKKAIKQLKSDLEDERNSTEREFFHYLNMNGGNERYFQQKLAFILNGRQSLRADQRKGHAWLMERHIPYREGKGKRVDIVGAAITASDYQPFCGIELGHNGVWQPVDYLLNHAQEDAERLNKTDLEEKFTISILSSIESVRDEKEDLELVKYGDKFFGKVITSKEHAEDRFHREFGGENVEAFRLAIEVSEISYVQDIFLVQH